MSWGLAQKTGHVMVQDAAGEGYGEIPSCIIQGCKGPEIAGSRGASDQNSGMASMAYGARSMKELGRIPADGTVAPVGTVQEEDCDGLCWQCDETLQIRAIQGCAARLGRRIQTPASANGRPISLVGTGPARLGCAYHPARARYSMDVDEKAQLESCRTLAPFLEKGAKAKGHSRQDADATVIPNVRLHRDKILHSQAVADLADKSGAVHIASGAGNPCSSNAHNIFRFLSSAPPSSASSSVASAGTESRASSTILAPWGYRLPTASDGPGYTKQKPTPHSPALPPLAAGRLSALLRVRPARTKHACTSAALHSARTATASGSPAQRNSMANAKGSPGTCGWKMKLSYTKVKCCGLFQNAALWRRQKQPYAMA